MRDAGDVVDLLVADVSPSHAEAFARQLREGGLRLRCRHAGSRAAMDAALRAAPVDLMLHSSRLTDPDCRGLGSQLAAHGIDAA